MLSWQSLVAVPAPRTCQGCRWLTSCSAHGSLSLLQLRPSGRPTTPALMTHRCVGVHALMSTTPQQPAHLCLGLQVMVLHKQQARHHVAVGFRVLGAHGVACCEEVLRMLTVAHTIVQPSRRCNIPPKLWTLTCRRLYLPLLLQVSAVNLALRAQDVALIHGPPGNQTPATLAHTGTSTLACSGKLARDCSLFVG